MTKRTVKLSIGLAEIHKYQPKCQLPRGQNPKLNAKKLPILNETTTESALSRADIGHMSHFAASTCFCFSI